MPQGRSTPTVAVAFGGGGARGLSHIHIIETLDELGIRPVAIAGSSIGSIMGAGMAAGMTGAAIREHVAGDRRQQGRRRQSPMGPRARRRCAMPSQMASASASSISSVS